MSGPAQKPPFRAVAKALVWVLDPLVTWLLHIEARAERYGEGR